MGGEEGSSGLGGGEFEVRDQARALSQVHQVASQRRLLFTNPLILAEKPKITQNKALWFRNNTYFT